jgi:hypothetical protein
MTLYRWHLFGLPEIDPNLCSENHYAISWSVPKDRFFHSGLHPRVRVSVKVPVQDDRFFHSGLHHDTSPGASVFTVQDDRFFHSGLHRTNSRHSVIPCD